MERRGQGTRRSRLTCLVIDFLGCASKFCRTNPAKDTLFAYLLGQAGILDDTRVRHVLLRCYFQVFGISLRKTFHQFASPDSAGQIPPAQLSYNKLRVTQPAAFRSLITWQFIPGIIHGPHCYLPQDRFMSQAVTPWHL